MIASCEIFKQIYSIAVCIILSYSFKQINSIAVCTILSCIFKNVIFCFLSLGLKITWSSVFPKPSTNQTSSILFSSCKFFSSSLYYFINLYQSAWKKRKQSLCSKYMTCVSHGLAFGPGFSKFTAWYIIWGQYGSWFVSQTQDK